MDARRAGVFGLLLLLLLGLAIWIFQPTPADPGPVAEPAVEEPGPRRRVVRPAPGPDPAPIPEDAVEEAMLAVSTTLDLPLIRCSVPAEVTARQAAFGTVEWRGNEVTAIVATASGRFPLTDLNKSPGQKTVGFFEWEDARPGVVTPCTWRPAGEVDVVVTVDGLPEGPARLYACDRSVEIPIQAGQMNFEIPEGELCDLVVLWQNEEGTWRRMFTTEGEMVMIRPFAATSVQLQVVDRKAMSDDEFQAMMRRSSERAMAAFEEPGRASPDLDQVLQRPDLTPGARAWLESRRR